MPSQREIDRTAEITALRSALPPDAVAELDELLRMSGAPLDEVAIARALLRERIVHAPSLPARFSTDAWIKSSGGRAYELLLQHPELGSITDAEAVARHHRIYLLECELVARLHDEGGMSLEDAWQRIRDEDASIMAELEAGKAARDNPDKVTRIERYRLGRNRR